MRLFRCAAPGPLRGVRPGYESRAGRCPVAGAAEPGAGYVGTCRRLQGAGTDRPCSLRRPPFCSRVFPRVEFNPTATGTTPDRLRFVQNLTRAVRTDRAPLPTEVLTPR